jgi:putative tricarboxylic transport membrane protein
VRGDAVTAAVLALVGLAGVSGGLSLGVWSGRQPGPGLIPCLAGGAVALSASLLLVATLAEPAMPARPAAPGGPAKVASVLGLMAAYAALVEPAGYVPATAGLLLALLRLVERVPLRLALPVALGAAVTLALLFGWLLGLPLRPWPAWIS